MVTIPSNNKTFRCPHCSNTVPMLELASFSGKEIAVPKPNKDDIIEILAYFGKKGAIASCQDITWIPEYYTVYKCPTCNNITIVKISSENINLENIKTNPNYINIVPQIVYPNTKIIDNNIVPLEICKIYEEAALLKNISPNSFAMTIRKALELLCDEQGAPRSEDIYNKLKKLSERNIFPKNIIEMGNIIRKVAKYGAHPKDEDISNSDAELLDDIFHLILEYVYITPYKVKQLQDKFEKVNK